MNTATVKPQATHLRTVPNIRSKRTGPPRGKRTNLFVTLFLLVVTLLVLGLLMVLSSSAVVSVGDTGSAWRSFNRQATAAAVGFVAMVVLMRINYHSLKKLAVPGTVLICVILVMLLVTPYGVTRRGATRWLDLGVMPFQPSEFAKLALICFIARILSQPSRDLHGDASKLVPVTFCCGVFAALFMMQPHLGNTLILGGIALAMLFWAGTKMRYMLPAGAIAIVCAAFYVWNTPWRRERLFSMLDPWSDPQGSTFQILNSLHAITTGGIRGSGLGDGLSKWGFVPYSHSDFIFAVVAEELGFVGASATVLLFLGIGIAGYAVALRAEDTFGMLLAVGITSWIVVQATLNLGSVIGLLPTVGVTLPMMSHGGSALVAVMAGCGILLNIARQSR